jgi:hypothetical protein
MILCALIKDFIVILITPGHNVPPHYDQTSKKQSFSKFCDIMNGLKRRKLESNEKMVREEE